MRECRERGRRKRNKRKESCRNLALWCTRSSRCIHHTYSTHDWSLNTSYNVWWYNRLYTMVNLNVWWYNRLYTMVNVNVWWYNRLYTMVNLNVWWYNRFYTMVNLNVWWYSRFYTMVNLNVWWYNITMNAHAHILPRTCQPVRLRPLVRALY